MGTIRLQGILYDNKSSFMKGPAKAPPRIREAYRSESSNYCAENGTEINPEQFEDCGDHDIDEYLQIEQLTLRQLEGQQPLITLGGDHSITYPVLRAFYKVYGPMDILHIDAHSDLYNSFEGDPYSHACPFARIMEDGLASSLTQVGIRTLTSHQQEQAKRFGVTILPLKDWHPDLLPAFKGPLYISLDMDALDPAFAPGVSHYEPGGFTTREILAILQKVKGRIVGADIVEFNPVRDIQEITAMVAAKFLKELAARMI